MKKILLLLSFTILTSLSFSQSGQKWATGGNGLSTGDFFGSTNNFALLFKVNNVLKMTLNTNGTLLLNNFSGSGSGLVTYDNNGQLNQLQYANDLTKVLYSNGTWGTISFPNGGWTFASNNLYFNGSGNVGVGNNNPTYKLDVSGTLRTTGAVQLGILGGSGNSIVLSDNSGNLSKLSFTGSSTNVLYANGTFGPVNFPSSGWTASGNNIYYNGNGNVGIGTNTPSFKLDVHGNIRVSDTVFTSGVVISSTVNAGTATLGSINATTTTVSGTATVAGNLGLGTTTPSVKLDVNGSANVSGDLNIGGVTTFTNKIRTARITALQGDSVIHFGDSSVIIGTSALAGNYIAWDASHSPFYKGFAIGINSKGGGLNSIVLGNSSFATGTNSISIGNFAGSLVSNAVVIGNGASQTHPLVNSNIANSLMVGFNSDIPTLFVSTSNGAGTIGKVGIGTTSPHCELDVNPPSGENGLCVTTSQTSGGFGILSLVNSDLANAIAVVNTSTSVQNFIVYGDGFVLCRDLKVTLNAMTHPDYVFEKSYNLISLDSLQNFITAKKHLLHFLSAKEVAANNGLSLAQTETSLLQTQEETTLYILQQHDEIKALKQEMTEMKKQMDDQQILIGKLLSKLK